MYFFLRDELKLSYVLTFLSIFIKLYLSTNITLPFYYINRIDKNLNKHINRIDKNLNECSIIDLNPLLSLNAIELV